MKIRSSLVLSLILIFSNSMTANAMNISDVFSDVKSHWAEAQIADFYEKGYINGYDGGNFKPNNNMTRAEFVKTFNRVFGLTNKSGKVFDDTKSHWAKDEIDIAVTNGVCNGISASKFEPNREITRQEMAVMIANYLKISDKNHDKLDKFNDKPASWAADSVEAIIENGIMNGYDGNYFKPQNKSTRAEVVATLSRINVENSTEESKPGETTPEQPGTGGGTSGGSDQGTTTPQPPSTGGNTSGGSDQGTTTPQPPSSGGNTSGGSDQGTTTPQPPSTDGDISGENNQGPVTPQEPSVPEVPSTPVVDQEKVNDVVAAISTIDAISTEVVLGNPNELDAIEANLNNLIKQYESLNEAEKAKVTNVETLEKARANVADARTRINAVNDALDEIPKAIDENNVASAETAVAKAKSLYTALPENYKNGIDSEEYKIVEKSEQTISTVKKTISDKKVSRVKGLIDGIDVANIFLDDENEINTIASNLNNIQSEYNSLSPEERSQVTNYNKLQDAKNTVNDIKQQLYAVHNAIGNIPEITEEMHNMTDLNKVQKAAEDAENLYNALPAEYKNGIGAEEYSIIVRTKEQVQRLKDAINHANDAEVLAIQSKINQLPELTKADMDNYVNSDQYDEVKILDEQIKGIFADWNALTTAQKNAVKRETLDSLYQKVIYAKAKIIEKEISKIELDKVTESDRQKLTDLQDAYDKLEREGQLLIENYSKLRDAIIKLNQSTQPLN